MQAVARKITPVLRVPLSPTTHLHLAPFHSTPASLAKWKTKWNPKDEGSVNQPSKTHIRYSVRQKRADTKKALKDFLLYGKSPKTPFEDGAHGPRSDKSRRRNVKIEYSSNDFDQELNSKANGKSKPHGPVSGKGKGGSKRWRNKHSFCDEDDYGSRETVFQAFFGGQNGFTWSSEGSHVNDWFEWRNNQKKEHAHRRIWSESDIEDEVDVGSHSDRVTLGLPPTGPLKLADVKCAFRSSALKWHPDKHQGPSQAAAEERFKLCVDAYNSLCNVLKPA